jgi:acetylornithine deacetylase/succinyl-diaminopimelate desuccinylase-like protein
MDGVMAEPASWEVDPFPAVNRNGYIYARGTLDMKSDGLLDQSQSPQGCGHD